MRQILIGCAKQFSELLNSFWEYHKVLKPFQQFLEVSDSSQNFQTVLWDLKDSQISQSSFSKFWTVLRKIFGGLKMLSEVSNYFRRSEIVSWIFKQFSVLSDSTWIIITRCFLFFISCFLTRSLLFYFVIIFFIYILSQFT